MSNLENRGITLREQAQLVVLDFMKSEQKCASFRQGISQTDIFRKCGFDWGDFPKAKSNNQVSWLNALMMDLEKQGKVELGGSRGLWRLALD